MKYNQISFMSDYLNYTFTDDAAFVRTYDELPLWSAPFGLLLLEQLPIKRHMHIADMGCGTGFPLLELAARYGSSCTFYGVDTWTNANARTKEKISSYNLKNVQLLECSAHQTPLQNQSLDLIVSNLGVNNFDYVDLVFQECKRLLKPNGTLAITTNLNGHWHLFYQCFEQVLQQLHANEALKLLQAQQEHRRTAAACSALFKSNGFEVVKIVESQFAMRFLDGTAFLNHHFVQVGWLSTWLQLIEPAQRAEVFSLLEQQLNQVAEATGELRLQVPMLYIEGKVAL